jgi:hypothetical protein
LGWKLPLGRPRHELALLALVAVVTLTPVYGMNAQDVSRLCLSRSLVHFRLSADKCLSAQTDKSQYGNHLYSDKAPGMSLIEAPLAVVFGLQRIETMDYPTANLWAVRILSSGLAFLLCALLVGRLAEGLAPGTGGAALVTFALGSSISGLAASNFGHVTAALLAFAAFLLAWGRRPVGAGLAAGAVPLVEYQAGAVLAILGVYAAVRLGRRGLGRYALGAVPGVAMLLAYDQLAFGAPWRLSYKYLDNGYAAAQAGGVFGVGRPTLFQSYEVFSGSRGLLVTSPVVVAAAWGLVLLWRRYTPEALVCAAVCAVFLILNCGYFLPYGGISPGPRFFVPALPFLAAGLGPAFAWRPRLTAILATVSIVASTGIMLVWSSSAAISRSIWVELAHIPVDGGSASFFHELPRNALGWVGIGHEGAAAVIVVAAAAACLIAFRGVVRAPAPASRRAGLAVGLSLGLVLVAAASAVGKVPFGNRQVVVPSVVATALTASRTTAFPGDEVDFVATAWNPTGTLADHVMLTINLPRGFILLGPPAYQRGSGCTGTTRISCNLDFMMPRMSTQVRFGVRVDSTAAGRSTVKASTAADNAPGRVASATVITGE